MLLPAHLHHSPRRPADTVGPVVERTRPRGVPEAFEWYCERCDAPVHRREAQVTNIETDPLPVFEEYHGDTALRP